ncbi:hypothetical protein SDJN02_26997, partial [Cucurbita argyrosperma subsp. argyrosperma]
SLSPVRDGLPPLPLFHFHPILFIPFQFTGCDRSKRTDSLSSSTYASAFNYIRFGIILFSFENRIAEGCGFYRKLSSCNTIQYNTIRYDTI